MTKPVANAATVAIIKPAKLPNACPFAAARRMGWEDVREGRAPNYHVVDAMPRKEAHAYERGRIQAALTRAMKPGAALPAWPMNKHIRPIVYAHLGAAKGAAMFDETNVGRSRQKTVKSQQPRPAVVPVGRGAGVVVPGMSPAMLAAANRHRRRGGRQMISRLSAEAEIQEIEGGQK